MGVQWRCLLPPLQLSTVLVQWHLVRRVEEKERTMRNLRGCILGWFGTGSLLGVLGYHNIFPYPLWIDVVGLILLCVVGKLLLIREECNR